MGVFSIGKVVVGSLFKKPSTLMYPVIPREWEERTRGAVAIDVDGCVLCGACARACPTNAIEVDRKAATWTIERMACIQCRGCVDNCPPKCLDMDQKYTEPGGEKIFDRFDIPQKKKAPKKDAPAKAGEAEAAAKAETAEATKAEAKEAAKEEAKAAPAEEPKTAAAPAAEGGLQCAVDDCVFCAACAEACPVDAIKVEDGTWEVDKDTCIECGACVDQCPANCLSIAEAGEAAPAEEAEEAPAEEPETETKEKAPAKEPAKADPKVEGYLADVKAALVKEFGLSEEDAAAKLDKSGLADQLKAFPYLMNKDVKEAAEKIK